MKLKIEMDLGEETTVGALVDHLSSLPRGAKVKSTTPASLFVEVPEGMMAAPSPSRSASSPRPPGSNPQFGKPLTHRQRHFLNRLEEEGRLTVQEARRSVDEDRQLPALLAGITSKLGAPAWTTEGKGEDRVYIRKEDPPQGT